MYQLFLLNYIYLCNLHPNLLKLHEYIIMVPTNNNNITCEFS